MASSTFGRTCPARAVPRSLPLVVVVLVAVVALVAIVVFFSFVLGGGRTPSFAPSAPTVVATAAAQPNTASYLDTAIHERDYCQCQK